MRRSIHSVHQDGVLTGSRAALLVILLSLVPPALPASAAVIASRGEITLPTYPWAAVKHPYFRGTDKVNIYPYPMLDFLSREKTNRTYRTVVLENEYLRITFLPELGGKIHEVIDKTTSQPRERARQKSEGGSSVDLLRGQPMFYVNHVIKPGLIGQCGAWISGGVEWNTGPQGHTVSAMQPVPVVILPPEKDGSRSVAIGETERIYGTKWTVVVTLRPGRSFIEERIRIYNPTEYVRPYYFWNCTAVPNTPGFRFIYPMTLGTDHGSEKFFHWPIHEGRDLSRGTNYEDASSIFAWHCDQDFFGSYDDGADRGVVSYANHRQVPGKKAWTWGQGGFGKMHQMDLTDTDGPYNEVQTGPLLTQGEVGRLDPCEAVEWQEWWYPVHGIGGFTFANKDVAVNAARDGTNLVLRILGTSNRQRVAVRLALADNPREVASAGCEVSPTRPVALKLGLPSLVENNHPLLIELRQRDERLALFRLPLDLPDRQPPQKKEPSKTASEFTQNGWQSVLFAKYTEAENLFRKALAADPKSAPARVGLASLRLDSDPASAKKEAEAAIAITPESGPAHYALAVAADRSDDRVTALDAAWQAALDPATAAAGRALVAKLEIRFARYREAADALSQPGPWQNDSLCRNRQAYACFKLGDPARAIQLAKENLATDPLDAFAQSVLWMANGESGGLTLRQLLQDNLPALMDLLAAYAEIAPDDWTPVQRLLEQFYVTAPGTHDPIASIWRARGFSRSGNSAARAEPARSTRQIPPAVLFPHRAETAVLWRDALDRDPRDGEAALYLGHLLFHLGRYDEGRALWKKAAALDAEPVIAYRALGMAAKTLDGDLKAAREWLEKANQADPRDAIVARDLAKVLFELADKADDPAPRRGLWSRARDTLKAAFAQGKGRSDFVSLLGRAQNRLGEYAETARMLDQVRVTVWEGSREVHDLFEDAHLELGKAHLASGRVENALVEFNRALEYPENLATGRMKNTREAHLHYQRGNALMALGRKQAALEAWQKAADEPSSKDAAKEEARTKARQAIEKAGP